MTGIKTGGKCFVQDGILRREVTEAEFEALFPNLEGPTGAPGTNSPASWPMVSEGAAVHPKQIEEANNYSRAMGVPTEHNALGQPVLTSREHRKRYNQIRGFFDKDGGYGD